MLIKRTFLLFIAFFICILRTMVGELFFFECYHMYFNKKLNADFQRSLYK